MTAQETAVQLARTLRLQERQEGAFVGRCPQCGGSNFWVSRLGFSCGSDATGGCAWSGTHEALSEWLEENGANGAPGTAPGTEGLPKAIPARDAEDDELPVHVVDEFLVEAEIHVWGGEGGSGKSSSVDELAASVASGFAAFDRFAVRTAGPVLIVSEEDSEAVHRNRLEALCTGHGWPVDAVLDDVHVLCLARAKIDEAHWQQHLIDETLRIGAKVVFLDPLFELTKGEENSNTEAKRYIPFLRRLASETRAAVVIVHHASKPSEGRSKKHRIRGAGALCDAARVVVFFEEDVRGIAIEPLKFSRGELPGRFVASRTIETDPDNKLLWREARLSYLTDEAAQEKGAEKLVREALEKSPGAMSTELKEAAKGTGVRAIEVSRAIKSLENRGVIRFEPGRGNAKHWHLIGQNVRPAEQRGQTGQTCLPDLPEPAGQTPDAPQKPAPLFRGQAGASSKPEATCHDCGTPVEPDPSFDVLRCTTCATKAGKEDVA